MLTESNNNEINNTEISKKTSSLSPLNNDDLNTVKKKSIEPADENLRTMFEQYYEHARHQELQRTGFATILGAILAAIISQYINLPPQNDLKFAVFVVGWLLSIIGFCLMYTWSRPFFRHYVLSEMIILKKWGEEKYSRLSSHQRTAKDWNFKQIFFAISSRNLFYTLTGLFTLIFGFLIGGIIADPEKHDSVISSTIDNFFPGNFEPILFGGFTVVILIILRIWFAYEELYAIKDILDKFNE